MDEEVVNDPANCREGKEPLRHVWRQYVGEVPIGHVVVRVCTTDGCVNPAHLRLRNVSGQKPKPPSTPKAALTPDQVEALRKLFAHRGQEQVRPWFARWAHQFNVSVSTVRRAVYQFGTRPYMKEPPPVLPTYNVYARVYEKDTPSSGHKAGDVRIVARVKDTENDRTTAANDKYRLVGTYPSVSARAAVAKAKEDMIRQAVTEAPVPHA